MIRTAAALSLLATLAACTSIEQPAQPAQPFDPGICNADRISPIPGHHISPEIEQRARQLSGAREVRVLRPGQAITREYRSERLNLQLNSFDVVVRAYCG